MWSTKRVAAALLTAICFGLCPEQCPQAMPVAASVDQSFPLTLEAGTGRVINLRGPAANVFVADPKIAEVRPASPGTLFVFGVGSGRTTIAAIDAAGQVLLDSQIVVQPSSFGAAQAQAAVLRAVPGGHVTVQTAPRGLIVTGQVATPAQAAEILAIVRSHLAEGQTLEDHLGVQSSVQVLLKVRIAEMSRDVTRDLGINWQALGSVGRLATTFSSSTAVGSLLTAGSPSALKIGTTDVNAIIDALAQDNLVRILAEPNLTAMSGQPASFLAGGEFPIPVALQNNEITVEFKQYGVKLTFVPTVLSSGRINLHVSPEVSELSTQGAVVLSASNSSLQIPAITVRRAETTVEVGSGQSFAIAGLLQNSVNHQTKGIPVLGDIPIVGSLFRSDSFERQETELVVVVTPYIARPVDDPAALRLPGQDTVPANDRDRIIGLQQNAPSTPGRAQGLVGRAGFIVQ